MTTAHSTPKRDIIGKSIIGYKTVIILCGRMIFFSNTRSTSFAPSEAITSSITSKISIPKSTGCLLNAVLIIITSESTAFKTKNSVQTPAIISPVIVLLSIFYTTKSSFPAVKPLYRFFYVCLSKIWP